MDPAPPELSGAPNIKGTLSITAMGVDQFWSQIVVTSIVPSQTEPGCFTGNGSVGMYNDDNKNLKVDASLSSSVYGRQASKIVPDYYVVRYYIKYR